jgi:plasmid maintenance system antidote protein VapI
MHLPILSISNLLPFTRMAKIVTYPPIVQEITHKETITARTVIKVRALYGNRRYTWLSYLHAQKLAR